jgi:hypothetical protein
MVLLLVFGLGPELFAVMAGHGAIVARRGKPVCAWVVRLRAESVNGSVRNGTDGAGPNDRGATAFGFPHRIGYARRAFVFPDARSRPGPRERVRGFIARRAAGYYSSN